MPRPLVARLHKEFVDILKMPDIAQKHAEVGAEIIASTPEQFHAYLKSEVDEVRQARESGRDQGGRGRLIHGFTC